MSHACIAIDRMYTHPQTSLFARPDWAEGRESNPDALKARRWRPTAEVATAESSPPNYPAPKAEPDRLGFEAALNDGDLAGEQIPPQELYELGVLYRAEYEILNGLRTPDRQEIRSTARHYGPGEAVHRARKALDRFQLNQPAIQIKVLDRVCGVGSTVAETATQLRLSRHTTEKLLRRALVCMAANVDGN